MPLRASSHPGSPNSPSCSALAWYSCWPGLSPWGESWHESGSLARQRWHAAATPLSQRLCIGEVDACSSMPGFDYAKYHYFCWGQQVNHGPFDRVNCTKADQKANQILSDLSSIVIYFFQNSTDSELPRSYWWNRKNCLKYVCTKWHIPVQVGFEIFCSDSNQLDWSYFGQSGK